MGTKYRRPRGSTGLSFKDDPKAYHRNYWRLIREEATAALGGRCQRCGYVGPALQIDHVDGDGHLVKCPGGKRYVYAALRDVLNGEREKYQLLCANCHVDKTYEQGDHLHDA